MVSGRSLCNVAATLLLLGGTGTLRAQEPASPQGRPMFRSAVDLVSVAAVVRDRKGRFVRDLKQGDFVVFEDGVQRRIVEFHADQNASVKIALLFDVSGSMRGLKIEEARQAARQVLSVLRLDAADEAAVFCFDARLQTLQRFTADSGAIEDAFSRVEPYGATSLYDAIAQTARRVAESGRGEAQRRAVIVLTDGVDTSSSLKPGEVSAIASGIDVPVYVMGVVSPIDHPGGHDSVVGESLDPERALRSLARWTGGEMFVTSAPAHESIAARQIVDELRHQYLLAFDAPASTGWRPLDVRTKDRDLTVRARAGYTADSRVRSVSTMY